MIYNFPYYEPEFIDTSSKYIKNESLKIWRERNIGLTTGFPLLRLKCFAFSIIFSFPSITYCSFTKTVSQINTKFRDHASKVVIQLRARQKYHIERITGKQCVLKKVKQKKKKKKSKVKKKNSVLLYHVTFSINHFTPGQIVNHNLALVMHFLLCPWTPSQPAGHQETISTALSSPPPFPDACEHTPSWRQHLGGIF